MPEFTYTARDNSGKKVTGTLTAGGRKEVVATLSSRSMFPLEITESEGHIETKKLRKVPAQTLAVVFSQMSDLLHSGVPLLRTLDVVHKQASHPSLKQVLGEVHDLVEQGTSLHEAMGRYSRIFPEMTVSMIRAGAEGGFLEEALERVAQFTEAQDDLKKRTVGAIAYPVFLGCIMFIVLVSILVFLVPMFRSFFDDMRKEGTLPTLTVWLLDASDFSRSYGIYMLGAGAGLYWFIRKKLSTEKGRWFADTWKLRLPLLGMIVQNMAVARFCRVLGTLLKNGVPLLYSLEISRDATGNKVLGEAISSATENISSGQSLAEPLAASGRFPVAVTEMISVAEQANNLETVLNNIADSLEKNTWRKLDLAVRLLEPIMLLVIALSVLLMAIALLIPMMQLSQQGA